MRKLLTSALILASAGLTTVHAASAAGLPRYSAVVDQTAAAFTVSYRNLGKTEYVTCSMPAPIGCGEPHDTQEDLSGGIAGAVRNEAGTLQVTAAQDGQGSVTITAYRNKDGSWDEVRSWKLVGGVNRAFAAEDGTHLAVAAADGSFVVYDTAKAAPVSKSTLSYSGGSAVTLSSTGKYLAWYKPATLGSGNGQRCYEVASTATGKTIESCEPEAGWDLVTEDNRVFAFAPDDSLLVLRSDKDGWQKPYQVNLAAGLPATLNATLMFAKPYHVADFVFVDSTHLALVANRAGATDWGLWNLAIPSNTVTLVADRASYGVPLKRFASYVSFGRTMADGVAATLWNVKSGSVTDIATLATGADVPTGDSIPAPTTKVTYPNGGGYALWTPASVSPTTPIVIYLHGGPYRQISSAGYHSFSSYGSFDWILEQVRRSGAIVAKLDYPGSYGYGRAYAESLAGNVGVTDLAAVRTLVTSLKAKYGASAPVYLVGNSYGGYLADKALVEMPNQIAGIYSISGVSGWEELVAANPNTIFTVQFKNAPFGQMDALFQQAEVLLKTRNIGNQKILLAHGDADTSVALSQTTTFDQLLKLDNKNVSTTIYPGENHVFTDPKDIQDLCEKAIGLIGGNAAGRCQI